MTVGYRVKKLKFRSGEEMSFVLDSTTGLPIWDPTLFILTTVRAANLSASTIDSVARSVMALHQILDHLSIDLHVRFSQLRVLDVGEVDAIAKFAGWTQRALDELVSNDPLMLKPPSRVLSLEKVRLAITQHAPVQQIESESPRLF